MSVQQTPPQSGEVISALLKSATDVIVAKYPRTVAISIGLGIAVPWLAELFRPWLQTFPIDLSVLSPYPLIAIFMVIGIAINARSRPPFPPDIENALLLIEVATKKGNLPKAQVKLLYIALCRQVIEDLKLTPEITKQLEDASKK